MKVHWASLNSTRYEKSVGEMCTSRGTRTTLQTQRTSCRDAASSTTRASANRPRCAFRARSVTRECSRSDRDEPATPSPLNAIDVHYNWLYYSRNWVILWADYRYLLKGINAHKEQGSTESAEELCVVAVVEGVQVVADLWQRVEHFGHLRAAHDLRAGERNARWAWQ